MTSKATAQTCNNAHNLIKVPAGGLLFLYQDDFTTTDPDAVLVLSKDPETDTDGSNTDKTNADSPARTPGWICRTAIADMEKYTEAGWQEVLFDAPKNGTYSLHIEWQDKQGKKKRQIIFEAIEYQAIKDGTFALDVEDIVMVEAVSSSDN